MSFDKKTRGRGGDKQSAPSPFPSPLQTLRTMSTSPPSLPPAKRPKLDEPIPVSPSIQTETISQIDLERAVGITEYIDPDIQGWTGILKQRYTDFLVNEIDEAGNVVHLTTLTSGKKKDPETKPKDAPKEPSNPPPPAAIDPAEFELLPADFNALAALTSADIAASCTSLYRRMLANPLAPPTTTITIPRIESKDSRSHLHTLIRTLYSSTLETQTLTGENEGKILLQPATTSTRRRGTRGGRNRKAPAEKMQQLGGEYCHFLLYKENKDTMQAVKMLQKLLKLGKGRTIGFAGTKDRRAVTVQRCSAYKVHAERLEALNGGGENGLHTGTRVGNFEYKTYGLELGDLKGNGFVITLRECRVAVGETRGLEEVVGDVVGRIREKGFINYFGLQRFGSYAVGTWEVGVKMLQGDWRGAVEKILHYDPGLLEDSTKNVAREDKARAKACAAFFVNYDYKLAAEKMPWKYSAESSILRVFAQRPQSGDGNGGGMDYLGAIQAVPRTLRTMYSHAYQSYVWNHIVSARIKLGAMKVIEGDLVLVEKASGRGDEVVGGAEVDQDGEVVVHAPIEKADEGRPRGQDDFQRARPLSKEEAESGKYTMKDIVLPTPGWDVLYPQNELLEVYRSVMAKQGLDPLKMKRTVKEYSLPGGYRKIIETFLDGRCDFEVRKYKGLEQIEKTDMEILNAAPNVKAEVAGEVAGGEDTMEVDDVEEKMAVVLKLRLATSTYATMALRELMREGIKAYKPEFSR